MTQQEPNEPVDKQGGMRELSDDDIERLADELEERMQPSSTRRRVLAGGAAGLAALLGMTGGAAAAPGTIGGGNETVDVGDVLAAVIRQIRIPGHGNLTTVQDAVNDIQNDDGMVLIPSQTWNETVTLDENIRFEGQGIGTKLEGSGGHTLEVTRQDAIIRDLWIDQMDSGGSWDAVHIGAREVRARDIDVDVADRHAGYVDARDCFLSGWRIIGAGAGASVGALKFTSNSNWTEASDILIRDNQGNFGAGAHGVVIDGGAAFLKVAVIVDDVPGDGLQDAGGDWNKIAAKIINVGGTGALLTGSKNNTYYLEVSGSGTRDVDVQGDNKTIYGTIAGELRLAGDDNWFWGSYGSLSESGLRNVVNGTVVSPETLSLGGADGTVSPTDLGVPILPFYVDAGGSASNLQGVDGVARDGQKIRVIHRGAEDVVLEDDASVTNGFKNQSGSNDTLANNGNMAEYVFDSDRGGVWYQTALNTQL